MTFRPVGSTAVLLTFLVVLTCLSPPKAAADIILNPGDSGVVVTQHTGATGVGAIASGTRTLTDSQGLTGTLKYEVFLVTGVNGGLNFFYQLQDLATSGEAIAGIELSDFYNYSLGASFFNTDSTQPSGFPIASPSLPYAATGTITGGFDTSGTVSLTFATPISPGSISPVLSLFVQGLTATQYNTNGTVKTFGQAGGTVTVTAAEPISPAPEPATIGMLLLGLVFFRRAMRRKN